MGVKEQLEAREKSAPRTVEHFENLLSKALGGYDRFDLSICAWPGRDDIKIGIRLLSDWDTAEAESCARAWARERGVEASGERMGDREFVARFAAECLARALVDPETRKPLVHNADELRRLATREEIDKLALMLSDHQESMAPYPHQLTDEELEKLAEALKKTRAHSILNSCAPSTLRRLALCMASQLAKSPGSPSSPTNAPGGHAPLT